MKSHYHIEYYSNIYYCGQDTLKKKKKKTFLFILCCTVPLQRSLSPPEVNASFPGDFNRNRILLHFHAILCLSLESPTVCAVLLVYWLTAPQRNYIYFFTKIHLAFSTDFTEIRSRTKFASRCGMRENTSALYTVVLVRQEMAGWEPKIVNSRREEERHLSLEKQFEGAWHIIKCKTYEK